MDRSGQTRAGVASNKTPRHINSKVLFGMIRRQQPISRAELSRRSGLRPSTVSLIVDELIVSGWVLEGEISKSARGRRPTMLWLNPQRCVVAVDLHPAHATVAVVELSGRIRSDEGVNLAAEPSRAIRMLAKAVREVIRHNPDTIFEGVGICLPGRTDVHADQLIFAPNLHWPAVRLKPRMERATGLRVEMDNVANACALSEVWFGSPATQRDFVVVAISEGIGTGIYINGGIARGKAGMAGEFGHVQIEPKGPPCNCGNSGCWETIASTRAALRVYRELSGSRRKISFAELLDLGRDGDAAARETLATVADALGRGMRTIAAALAPSEIVVVGDITKMWESIGPRVEKALHQSVLARGIRLRAIPDSGSARLRSAVALVLADHPFAGDASYRHH